MRFCIILFSQSLAVQMAMIVSDATAQVQFAYLLAHRGKYTIIEEMIGWNQKFRTFINRLLLEYKII